MEQYSHEETYHTRFPLPIPQFFAMFASGPTRCNANVTSVFLKETTVGGYGSFVVAVARESDDVGVVEFDPSSNVAIATIW